jgi:hypothetical protein
METIKIQKIMEEILKLFEQMEVVDELTLSGKLSGRSFLSSSTLKAIPIVFYCLEISFLQPLRPFKNSLE